MIVRNLATLTILATLISGCASFGLGTKKVQVITKPVQIEIMQPSLPREISLVEPQWYVVSEAKIANPCLKNEEGKRDCTLGKENPDWPDGLEPKAGRKRYRMPSTNWKQQTFATEKEAIAWCKEWNDTHEPGRYSLKAEFEET